MNRVRAELAFFVADVFASVLRKDQRAMGDCCLRGLMPDGRRRSVQAMAARLPDGNEQNLQQFVNQSTWDPVPVRRRIAERMSARIRPEAGRATPLGGVPRCPGSASGRPSMSGPKAPRSWWGACGASRPGGSLGPAPCRLSPRDWQPEPWQRPALAVACPAA
ncbi:hypothetical protein GCM10010431_73790 [Streptomyces kunmingensis]